MRASGQGCTENPNYSSMEAHRAITRALLEDGQSPLIRTKENGQSPYGVLYTCNVMGCGGWTCLAGDCLQPAVTLDSIPWALRRKCAWGLRAGHVGAQGGEMALGS